MTVIATREGVRAERVVVPITDSPRQEARLSFDTGVERLDLRSGAGADTLLSAEFGQPLPVVWAADRAVHLEYPLGSRLLRRSQPNVVRLNAGVPWAFDVHGGATEVNAELTDVDLRSVVFHSGAAHIRLALGRPSSPRTVRMGSVKDLRIERPAGVPVKLEMTKGATQIVLDERRYGAVGGGLAEHTPGYHPDEPHYAVHVAGGADTVNIVKVA